MDFLHQIGHEAQQLIEQAGYFGIFLAALIETVFPPLPSELIMPFAGFLTGRGQFSYVGVVAAGTAGTVVGAIPVYYVGWWASDHVLRALIRRYGRWFQVSERTLDRAVAAFDRHGTLMVFGGRLIPTVRTLISVPAGMDHMPLGKFLLFTALGSTIWTALLVYAGVLLGENWESVVGMAESYKDVLIVAVLVLSVGTGVAFMIRRTRLLARNAGRQAELDAEG